jgi:hypothetical protein
MVVIVAASRGIFRFNGQIRTIAAGGRAFSDEKRQHCPPTPSVTGLNAPAMGSFQDKWSRPSRRLLNRQKWRTNLELAIAMAMADHIEHFYNCERRHSSLGYLTPNEFDTSHSTPAQQATVSQKVVH